MRAVVQRSLGAEVSVDGTVVGRFDGPGLVVLVGVGRADRVDQARRLAAKVHDLRIFDRASLEAEGACLPPGGPRELSAADAGLPLLVISQFTLQADLTRGRRPSWEPAAPAEQAAPLVDAVIGELRSRGATVATGRFGANMRVALVNDGPMTIVVTVD